MTSPKAQTTDPDAPAHGRKRSPGEIAFNRVVYTGIGFGVNEASSLWITDQFVHGKNLLKNVPGLKKAGAWFSQEGYERASENIANLFKLTEKVAADGAKILPKERAGNGLLMVMLLSGGTLLLLPMKWLEDNKIYWVKKANHTIDKLCGHHKTPQEVAARDAEVEKAIACSPRQSWHSMLSGRLVAMASSVAAGTLLMGPQRNQKLMDWSEKLLTGSLQPAAHRTASHRYARLVSVETYSCAISSMVLEMMSKFHARRSFKPHDPVICARDEALPAAAPAPADDDKNADCGCTGGGHAAKIQSRRDMSSAGSQAMGV